MAAKLKRRQFCTRIPKTIEYGGRIQTVRQWAQELDMTTSGLRARLRRCYTIAEVLGEPKLSEKMRSKMGNRQRPRVADDAAHVPPERIAYLNKIIAESRCERNALASDPYAYHFKPVEIEPAPIPETPILAAGFCGPIKF